LSEKQVTYILDTNVLLHSPNALNAFKKCDIVIPLCVVEELDSQKRRQDDAGKNARNTIKTIDKIQESGNYKTKSNANVRIETFEYDMMDIVDLDPRKCDNQIINVAAKLKAQGESVILISNDAACRVKARYFGLEAQVFEKDRIKVDLDEVYSGLQELLLPGHEIDGFYREGELLHYDGEGLYENQFLLLKDECDPKHTALAKYQDSKVLPLKYSKMKPWDITPRNMEQFFFLEALMDPKIQLVSAVGAAGCGKSLLATAAGGEQVVEQKLYRRLVYYKSVIPIGPDLGALPGDESDKLRPFMASAYDTFEYLMGDNERLDELISKKLVELSALTYARGRSLPGLFMIVDECVAGNTHIATDYGKHKKNSISHLYSMYKQGKNLPLVLTYNEKNDIFEYKKIVNVKCRGEREVLEIKVGGRRIRCTANHPFLTERYGWLRADELQKGYLIKAYKGENQKIQLALNDDQLQVVVGSYLGDGSFQETAMNRYRLNIVHCEGQREYCEAKAELFNCKVREVKENGYAKKSAYCFSTKVFGFDEKIPKQKTFIPQWMLDQIDARGLAIWFMDDGSATKKSRACKFHSECFDRESLERAVEMLKTKFNLTAYIRETHRKDTNKKYLYIQFRKKDYLELCKIIAPYIHENLEYKICPELRSIEKYKWNNSFKNYGVLTVEDIKITNQEEMVYDIEIEDNHNFIVVSSGKSSGFRASGPILHNCQNISPHEIKTIISRAAEGTKVVIIGDPWQVDHRFLDSQNNGLVYAVERLKGQKLFAHITLKKPERSALSGLAATLL